MAATMTTMTTMTMRLLHRLRIGNIQWNGPVNRGFERPINFKINIKEFGAAYSEDELIQSIIAPQVAEAVGITCSLFSI